jgi:hypothetical protein
MNKTLSLTLLVMLSMVFMRPVVQLAQKTVNLKTAYLFTSSKYKKQKKV